MWCPADCRNCACCGVVAVAALVALACARSACAIDDRVAADCGTGVGLDDGGADEASRSSREARATSDLRRRDSVTPVLQGEAPAPGRTGWRATAGSQIRLRGDFALNQSLTDLSFNPGRGESQLLERSRVSVTVENATRGFTLLAEGQWYARVGGRQRRSDFDLYRAYVEWRSDWDVEVTLRVGRQEVAYGSMFFLGSNDFYNGLTWDGLRASMAAARNVNVDLVVSRMAKLNPGDPDIYLAGSYVTYDGLAHPSIEGYVFWNRGGFPFFHREFELQDSGQQWFTAGLRAAGSFGGLSYEAEPMFQWGTVKAAMGNGSDAVRAYGGHVDGDYAFDVPGRPRIFAAYAFGSGCDDLVHGTYGEFHGNVFNDSYLTGDIGFVPDLSGLTVDGVHASGMHVGVAGFSVSPCEGVEANVDVHHFVAAHAPRGLGATLGTELDFVMAWNPTPWLSVLLGVARFWAGDFVHGASGSTDNLTYAYLQTGVDF